MKKITKYFILIIFALGVFVPVYSAQALESWKQIFPECIQLQMSADWNGQPNPACDDVGVFVQLAINIGAYLFTFIGALALLVFVYGGFRMIISAGASDEIKKGKDAMVASVIGLVIAFSGVAIVRLLGDSLNVNEQYKINDSPLGTCTYKFFEAATSESEGGVVTKVEKVSESVCKEKKGNPTWVKIETENK